MEYFPHIEALVFSSTHPIGLGEIKYALEEVFEKAIDINAVEQTLEALIQKYNDPQHGIELVFINKGYHFLSKSKYHPVISSHLRHTTHRKLSKVTLETLAIIAYKQPVTKPALERIRGVNCDYAINKLLDKELINIIGRSEAPGRPLMYGTSEKFINYFGLGSIEELPTLKDFELPKNNLEPQEPIPSVTSQNDQEHE